MEHLRIRSIPLRPLSAHTRRRVVLLAALAAGGVGAWALTRSGDDGEDAARGVSPAAGKLAAGLDRDQQARAVLALGFVGEDPADGAAFAAGPQGLGAVLVRPENWLGLAQGSALIAEIKTAAGNDPSPPLVIAPQEGGPDRAFAELPPAERQIEIGDFADSQRAAEWAASAGNALVEAGFDVVLSPVADVASLFSPIAERSFSDSPQIAATMTAAALRGCRVAHIACAVAHFPGLGGASQDTDEGPATVSLDRESLAGRDLAAFAAAIAERVPIIVLSHAFYAAFDPVTPASLSPQITTDLLRDEMGFRGVAMTDDLSTGAIRATSSPARPPWRRSPPAPTWSWSPIPPTRRASRRQSSKRSNATSCPRSDSRKQPRASSTSRPAWAYSTNKPKWGQTPLGTGRRSRLRAAWRRAP